jgi:hypothetical protein
MGRPRKPCAHGKPISTCLPCQAAQKRARYVPRGGRNKTSMKKMVKQYKIALKHCVICLTEINEKNFMMFALDHRDPAQKLFNCSKADGKPFELVLAECRKCELMCHNCHHLKTHQSGDHKVRRDEPVQQDEYLPLLEMMYATD